VVLMDTAAAEGSSSDNKVVPARPGGESGGSGGEELQPRLTWYIILEEHLNVSTLLSPSCVKCRITSGCYIHRTYHLHYLETCIMLPSLPVMVTLQEGDPKQRYQPMIGSTYTLLSNTLASAGDRGETLKRPSLLSEG